MHQRMLALMHRLLIRILTFWIVRYILCVDEIVHVITHKKRLDTASRFSQTERPPESFIQETY